MTEVTPETVMAAVAKGKPYQLVLLKRGPNFDSTNDLQMQHLLHIFTTRAAGQQLITLPVMDAGDLAGISVYAGVTRDEAAALAAADPGVKAGRFTFEVLSCMGLPGDTLR